MGKKYLETKNKSLESSILGVWKTAVEEGAGRMDGRTSEYRNHRKKLESARTRREDKKVSVKKEEPVDPKDREELDKEPDARGGAETAKKMKKAQEPQPGQMAEAQSGGKEEYQKFFNAALKKFKVSSPADLKGDQKKKFYDYVDKNWEGDNEKAEGAMSQVREFKMQSLKSALASIWGMEEGHNPFKKLEDNKDADVVEDLADSPNPANKQHLCAKNVVHEEWGDGKCIPTQHADPDEEGNVAWYDIMFEHGIEREVSTDNLTITEAGMHIHASHKGKKKKKEEVSKTETGKKAAVIDLKPKIKDQ